MEYNFGDIERKWQQFWSENQTFKAENHSDKPKYYVLDMFPYPSGAGLHVGHPLGYIASDIFARYKRLKGFNVLHPMGYDAFGLPAEQYAIQTGQHPAKTTEENIKRYREQLDKIGFSFDWSREVRTSDPNYYKWTQWIFLQLFKSWYNHKTQKAEAIDTLIAVFEKEGYQPDLHEALTGNIEQDVKPFTAEEWKNFSEKEKSIILMNFRLAYLDVAWVNWCPAMGTVLANDEVKDGVSERGGYPVERKRMPQWSMRITAYAERLLNDLNTIDWTDSIKEAQRNWIGKSEGSSIRFKLDDSEDEIEVFTTRPDTIFGVTFVTLAPEHELVEKITTDEYRADVEAYVNVAKNKSERERQAEKKVSGQFTGAYVIHPFTGEKVPVWIGEYVLAGYGTGAVMAVPAHDSRDHAFATHFGLGIPQVIEAPEGWDITAESYDGKEGKCINSDFLNGLDVKKAIHRAIEEIEKRGIGKGKVNYRLRDAAFGRQRYWGEPIPVYYKDGVPTAMNESELPLVLPEIDAYKPTETGEPPLGRAKDWKYEGKYEYELTTMPGWAGSSWYYLRYMDPHNDTEFVSQEAVNYWENVDLYMGGSEHATGHLLYVRFWTKFLYDVGKIPVQEPAKKLINQGMILGYSHYLTYSPNTHTIYSHSLIATPKGLQEQNLMDSEISNFKIPGEYVDNDHCLILSKIDDFKNEFSQFKDYEFKIDKSDINDPIFELSYAFDKMSKSKRNVVNPDDICDQYGADCLRLYEMFLGPLELSKPWNTNGITGVSNFLRKFWRLFYDKSGAFIVSDEEPTKAELKPLHKLIKKVQDDIERFSFNTSVSNFMICVNELTDLKCSKRAILEPLAIIISPYAPHIAEELWQQLGHNESITYAQFPDYNEEYLVEDAFEYPISFNGKMRFKLELSLQLSKEEIEKEVMSCEEAQKWLEGKSPKKVIVVPNKIVNIVI